MSEYNMPDGAHDHQHETGHIEDPPGELTHPKVRKFHILNLGAGVQSTALYLMFYLAMVLRGEVQCSDWAFAAIMTLSEAQKQWLADTFPKLDYAIFADTMDEPDAVYAHLEWLKELHGRWRYPQFKEFFANRPLRKVFLFVDNDITRKGCVDFLKPLVPHETPRSACKFCPFHDDNEWDRQKREDPSAWAESVAIDYALRVPGNVVNRNLNQPLFLHRSCKPLDLVQLDPQPNQAKAQLAMNFNSECLGVCGV